LRYWQRKFVDLKDVSVTFGGYTVGLTFSVRFFTLSGKRCHYIFASNFAKHWPIFKILSSADLAVNL